MYIQYTKLFQESIQFYTFKITISQRIEKICMFNENFSIVLTSKKKKKNTQFYKFKGHNVLNV